jgi:hypothetical protein
MPHISVHRRLNVIIGIGGGFLYVYIDTKLIETPNNILMKCELPSYFEMITLETNYPQGTVS